MRLFFSIVLKEEIRDQLCSVMEKIRPCCAGGRFTRRENLHVTLVFLGEISSLRAEAAKRALAAVRVAPFPLNLGGFGCFRRDGGDLFWAGVERTEPLVVCHRQLCAELRKEGFPPERRSYRPHLTLVRQAVLQEGYDCAMMNVSPMSMPVDKISLMKSERVGGKLIYTEVDFKTLSREENI